MTPYLQALLHFISEMKPHQLRRLYAVAQQIYLEE